MHGFQRSSASRLKKKKNELIAQVRWIRTVCRQHGGLSYILVAFHLILTKGETHDTQKHSQYSEGPGWCSRFWHSFPTTSFI